MLKEEKVTVLIVPGYGDSGPGHWQSLWQQKQPAYRRVEQQDWEFPQRDQWVATLEQTVAKIAGPIIFVAHSLGCTLVAQWAATYSSNVGKVQGALLVAPPDVEQPGMSLVIEGFSPVPLQLLPFRSILVASSNDRFISLEQSTVLAHAWGSHFVNIGPAGHINTDSGFGEWPLGETFLTELFEEYLL